MLWFTEENGNRIGRITTDGSITEYPIPSSFASPQEIVTGSDGALWFTEFSANPPKIGRITTEGTINEYSLPIAAGPDGITAGPDGAIWFTENGRDEIGRIHPSDPGTPANPNITHYPLLAGMFNPGDITSGPDGRLWFTLPETNMVGAIDPATGSVQSFDRPGKDPSGIVASSNSLWFTQFAAKAVENISTAGATLGSFPTGAGPSGISFGPDGALWFTEAIDNKIGRLTTNGGLTEFTIPTSGSEPGGIAAGPDGSVWFTEFQGNKIGRIRTGYAPTNLVVNQSSRIVTASWTLPLPAPETFSGFLEFSPSPDVDADGFFTHPSTFGYLLDGPDTTFDSTPDRFPAGTYYVHVSALDPTTCDELGFCRDEFSQPVVLVVPPDPQPQPQPEPAPAPPDRVTALSSAPLIGSRLFLR